MSTVKTQTAREILSDDEVLARRDRNAFDGGFQAGAIYGMDLRAELLEALKAILHHYDDATFGGDYYLGNHLPTARENALAAIAKAEAK